MEVADSPILPWYQTEEICTLACGNHIVVSCSAETKDRCFSYTQGEGLEVGLNFCHCFLEIIILMFAFLPILNWYAI